MKNIGIKLADGTFYPVLQDNVPSEKALKLTTAHNNQTKVMVDLYRSETDTMKDAEYVDSLQIENLIAHPNGEPDIAFSISLDDENQLSAKIVDSETGRESDTTITLVSRTIEERLYTDEYDIKELEVPAKRKGLLAAASALLGGAAVASAVNSETEKVEEKTAEETIVAEEPIVEEDPVVVEEEAPTDEETFVDEPSLEDFAIPEETESVEETPVVADEEMPAFEEPASEEPPAADNLDLDLPDFGDMPAFDEPVAEESPVVEETPAMEEDQTVYEEKPMFTPDENIADMDIDFTVPVTPTAVNSIDSYEFNLEKDIEKDSDLDLNDMNLDFDFPEVEEKSEDLDLNMDMDIDLDLSIPEPEVNEEDMSKKSYTGTHSNGGISFTGLYDKETELGTSATPENNNCKKTKAPVIICVICAIICILATAFVLLVVPSKFNLLGKTGDGTVVVEQPVETPAPVAQPEPVVEPEPEVEEIVIIEKAEEVIPEQPPVAVEKPKDITYKIKWGDTLWDISDTYYKNPWRYKYIARFNGIKDPDYIISGTYITIPAE